ncbi:hypothetical protein ACFX2I_006461 [Malus domestica]
MARFWWGSDPDLRMIHWKSWDKLCIAKSEDGGSRIFMLLTWRWLIEDGASIRVWSDRWVPRPSTFHPITMLPLCRQDMRVHELIDVERKAWCDAKLTEFFEEEDKEHICALPISYQLSSDKLIWHYNDLGIFTIKSAYWVAWDSIKPLSLSASFSASGGNPFTPLWKAIWKANPPKV